MPSMIFLTGATGHTGSRLARRLIESGCRIRCLVHTPAHAGFLPPSAEIVHGDARDSAALAGAMEGADACLHWAHIRYAESVAEACRRAGVRRFICMSSTRRFTRFACESSRQVIEGEAAVERSGLDWTILRCSMIYGGERDNNLERLVRYFQRTPFFPLAHGGRQLVQPVFVWDVVAAALAALSRPLSIGKAYTLAGPAALPYRVLVEEAARAAGRKKIVLVPAPHALLYAAAWILEKTMAKPPATTEQIRRFLEDKVFSIDDAVRDLDFRPVSFAEGMRRKAQREV